MRRRDFITAFAGATLCPMAARAREPAKVAHIGFLATGLLSTTTRDAFYQGLHEHGYIDGQNIVVEARAANAKIERFPALARELVALNPDVIVASNSVAGRAVHEATTTIPIVIPVMGDPIGDGLATSLARPGGNITGLTFLGPQLVPKRLALLKEALPTVSKVLGLWHPGAYGERTMRDMMNSAQHAAQSLSLQLHLIGVRRPDEIDQALSAATGEGADALMVFPSPMLFQEQKRIVGLTERLRLPMMSMAKEFVQLGGLMSYGADITDSFRLSATYVDKILRGAKPADLPIEQPTKFELFINLKTAKALGLEIRPSVLAQADGVIEEEPPTSLH
jgi:ABC-type uncharacterized transport system substrate-binding protein